jgi:UrcA family protein
MKHLVLAAAALAGVCALPAAAHAESVRINVAGIDLASADGQRSFARRARAASFQACGQSFGRGAADHANNMLCRAQFMSAAQAEADRRKATLQFASK